MLVRTRLLLLPGILLALVARGFDLQTDESDVYTVKWHRPNVALEIRMPNSTSLSDGRTASASVRDAAETWNTQIEFFTFNSTLEPITPRVAGNGRNELVIESKIAGSDFGSGVLAVTLISHDGNEILETDIVFNAGENWDSYSGPRRSRPDAVPAE